MRKTKKAIKIKWQNVFALVLFGFALGVGYYFLTRTFSNLETGYLKGNEKMVAVYDENGQVVDHFPRGTEASFQRKDEKTVGEEVYYPVTIKNKKYFVRKDDIASDENKVIVEKQVYVRTAYHLMHENLDGTLLDLILKEEELEVLGYHQLLADGSVDYYKVEKNGNVGYFPSQYTVLTKEEAALNYDENGIYQIHASRGNVYGGGSAKNADYFPVSKPKFEDNVMPEEVRALYLNGTKGVMAKVDSYIELAKQSNINAFVVDIKDSEVPTYQSEVMKIYSKTNYENAKQSMEQYRQAIQKLKQEGFYVIGRISVFKDKYYAEDHPENAILSTKTNTPYYLAQSYWPTPYSREVWKFNVDLAKEAVKEMGFHEIQFDYVRFPDRVISLEKQGLLDFRNVYQEEKLQAVQRFLMYATNELHAMGVYVSCDVFGESAHTYVTAYGQYWPAISNVVDVISGMPYPDHFGTYEYGFKEPVWTKPYEILNYWGEKYASKRQEEIPTPAISRTWIQAYDSIKKPKVIYGAEELSKEIQGLYDAGLTGGYMTWNSGSNLEKYRSQIKAFSKEYLR